MHRSGSAEPDLWYHTVHSRALAGFVRSPANLIATLSDTGYLDPGAAGSYYALSAVDVNDDESGFAAPPLFPDGAEGFRA